MPITFHCECCKQKIKAPDEAGGKWGNCPHCQHRCYIPMPVSEDEPELRLAPIDQTEETQYEQMMHETRSLTQNILHERQTPREGVAPPMGDEKALIRAIVLYLRQMAGGQLDSAERTAGQLKAQAAAVKDLLRRMAKAERPEPELGDIAPKVLQGFMKGLYSKL